MLKVTKQWQCSYCPTSYWGKRWTIWVARTAIIHLTSHLNYVAEKIKGGDEIMEYTFKGIGNCDSKCDIEIIKHDAFTLIIATELPDNPGTSITNWAEHLATEIAKKEGINMPLQSLIWIEHYPESDSRPFDETWDYVRLWWSGNVQRFHDPEWARINVEDVETLKQGIRIPDPFVRGNE